MGKKSSEKKAKREFENFEKNKIEVIEKKESKEIHIQNIDSKKLSKYEKIKKFRNLENVSISYEDNEKDKFKDFQEMYNLINNEIEVQDKKWICSEKNKIFYILPYQFITTEVIDGIAYDENNYEGAKEELEKISNKLKDEKLNFDLPTRNILELLDETNLMEYNGEWVCKVDDNNEEYFDYCYTSENENENDTIYYDEYPYNLIGIDNLDNFFKFLETRNKKSNFKNNDLRTFDRILKEKEINLNKEYDYEEILEIIDTINDDELKKAFEEVEDEFQNGNTELKDFFEEYQFSLLEDDNLRDFEVILNYNLLDSTIITKEYEKKFNKLSETYRTYKKYISCIYNENYEKVGIFFDTEKIIESIKNREKIFNNIEIAYLENKLGIEKEVIYLDKNSYYYKNGDIEEVYGNSPAEKKSVYYYKNGEIEERIYQNGILNGKSILKFSNGEIEERSYRNGILEGKAIYKTENRERAYFYTDGTREEMPILRYYLSIDRERINIDDYDEERLWDINLGHWDLKEEDKEELKEILGKKVYERDPKEDVHQGGIVGIDFGTKSTVVVYQKNNTNIMPMRISGGILNKEVVDADYENPTVIEFRNIKNFLEKYNEKDGRPNTRWEDVMVSHTAFTNLTEGPSEYFSSIISDIKQWTIKENEKLELKDRTETEYTLPSYLDLDENDENYIDPVELYAYYIGSYINTMTNGIYLEYLLSFPVTYEKAIREKILKSFERGIKKSLPIQIQEDEKLMKKFKVNHGANEPAAYAACALKNFKIEPKDKDDKVYYGVFDFGGGTTDFDFGIWKIAEDEDKYDYELEHFGAGGDKYLGGENIIKELAYIVFNENFNNYSDDTAEKKSEKLRKKRIQYIRPEGYNELKGEESLINNNSSIASLNTRILAEKLRGIWENYITEDMKIIKLSHLYDSHGEKRGIEKNDEIELIVPEDELRNFIREKIDKGINNFFIKLEDAFKDEDAKEINIFLAGNSCKHPFVNEIFAEYQEKMKDKIKLNLYDLKAIEGLKEKDSTKVMPTGKTGVAYGLIYSRKGGRIKVTNRDEKENMANEVNFKFYIGNNKRDLFNTVLSPNSKYEKYEYFGKVTSDTFEIYYTTLPEAQTGKMEIDRTNVKRISLNEEYDEDEEYRIYIKATKPTKISYAIVKKEEDVDTKEFLEEGEIVLS